MATITESRSRPVEASHARRWWILAVLGVAQLMVVLDATVVTIALPDAQHALGFSDTARQWVVTGYSLAFGSLLLLGGRLSDLFGKRNTFIIGLIGFAVASAVGGAANGFDMLVAARIAQGAFAALLAPAALSLLTITFTEPSERARAFGIFSAIAGAGAAIGLLLGGALTEWASWRWVLFVNLVFAGVALLGAIPLLAGFRNRDRRSTLDLPGTIAATAGLFSLVYGFSRAATHGWANGGTAAFLAVGVALLLLFVGLQTRVAHPLLPLRIVLDRTRAGAYLAVFVTGIGMFAIFLFLTYYMQLIRGYSPVMTGVAYLPMVVGMVLASTSTPILLQKRVGTKVSATVGFLIAACGIALLTGIGPHTTYASHILPGTILLGAGLGMTMAVAFQAATAGVRHADAGVASAMVNTSQQVGAALGTALLSTIATSAASSYLSSHQPSRATLVLAQIHSYTTAFWWVAGLLALGAIIVATLIRHRLPAPVEGEPALAAA